MSGIYIATCAYATNLTVTTTTELLCAYSLPVKASYQTVRYCVRAWLNITMSAASTTITLRIRRGNGITGAVVGGGFAENVVASNTDDFNCCFSEQQINAEFADYSLTVQMAAASGNSTVNAAMIEVATIAG